MKNDHSNSEFWENPECPEQLTKECFPPVGICRLMPHHFRWWRRPWYQWWWWWRRPIIKDCCCCCYCCKEKRISDDCNIELRLSPNTFGRGRAIRIVLAPGIYYAEFYLEWNASGAVGQLTVDLELISAPSPVITPQLLANNRGANDRFLFATTQPGRYLFRATVTDSQGNSCFATYQVDVPRV